MGTLLENLCFLGTSTYTPRGFMVFRHLIVVERQCTAMEGMFRTGGRGQGAKKKAREGGYMHLGAVLYRLSFAERL